MAATKTMKAPAQQTLRLVDIPVKTADDYATSDSFFQFFQELVRSNLLSRPFPADDKILAIQRNFRSNLTSYTTSTKKRPSLSYSPILAPFAGDPNAPSSGVYAKIYGTFLSYLQTLYHLKIMQSYIGSHKEPSSFFSTRISPVAFTFGETTNGYEDPLINSGIVFVPEGGARDHARRYQAIRSSVALEIVRSNLVIHFYFNTRHNDFAHLKIRLTPDFVVKSYDFSIFEDNSFLSRHWFGTPKTDPDFINAIYSTLYFFFSNIYHDLFHFFFSSFSGPASFSRDLLLYHSTSAGGVDVVGTLLCNYGQLFECRFYASWRKPFFRSSSKKEYLFESNDFHLNLASFFDRFFQVSAKGFSSTAHFIVDFYNAKALNTSIVVDLDGKLASYVKRVHNITLYYPSLVAKLLCDPFVFHSQTSRPSPADPLKKILGSTADTFSFNGSFSDILKKTFPSTNISNKFLAFFSDDKFLEKIAPYYLLSFIDSSLFELYYLTSPRTFSEGKGNLYQDCGNPWLISGNKIGVSSQDKRILLYRSSHNFNYDRFLLFDAVLAYLQFVSNYVDVYGGDYNTIFELFSFSNFYLFSSIAALYYSLSTSRPTVHPIYPLNSFNYFNFEKFLVFAFSGTMRVSTLPDSIVPRQTKPGRFLNTHFFEAALLIVNNPLLSFSFEDFTNVKFDFNRKEYEITDYLRDVLAVVLGKTFPFSEAIAKLSIDLPNDAPADLFLQRVDVRDISFFTLKSYQDNFYLFKPNSRFKTSALLPLKQILTDNFSPSKRRRLMLDIVPTVFITPNENDLKDLVAFYSRSHIPANFVTDTANLYNSLCSRIGKGNLVVEGNSITSLHQLIDFRSITTVQRLHDELSHADSLIKYPNYVNNNIAYYYVGDDPDSALSKLLRLYHHSQPHQYGGINTQPFIAHWSNAIAALGLSFIESIPVPDTNYVIKFPKDTATVRAWGQVQRHCIGSYSDRVNYHGQSLMFGVWDTQKDDWFGHCLMQKQNQYFVESQFYGRRNSHLPQEEKKKINSFVLDYLFGLKDKDMSPSEKQSVIDLLASAGLDPSFASLPST